jgi:hypothetical protein
VRQRDEIDIEKVGEARVFAGFRLWQGSPKRRQIIENGPKQSGRGGRADKVANDKEQQGLGGSLPLKQQEIDLEDRLEETQVGTMVQTHSMFPHVDDKHLGHSQRKQRTFTLKLLNEAP